MEEGTNRIMGEEINRRIVKTLGILKENKEMFIEAVDETPNIKLSQWREDEGVIINDGKEYLQAVMVTREFEMESIFILGMAYATKIAIQVVEENKS